MIYLKNKKDKYWFSLLTNPLARVLKFKHLYGYLNSFANGGYVLDYGSGDRPYEKMLLRKFNKYIAVDYIPTSKKFCKKPDIYINSSELPFLSNVIDCIVFTEVMHYLYDPKIVVAELYRILKPGGKLIGSVPFAFGEDDPPNDFYRYTYFSLKKIFEDACFEIINIEYVGDMIGVYIVTTYNILYLIIKLFRKIKLGFLGLITNIFFKIPEYIYYYCYIRGIKPKKFNYLRKFPLGFTFYLEKKSIYPQFHSLKINMGL